MESHSADEHAQAHGQTDTTDGMTSPPTNESSNDSGLPSPPSSTYATRSASDGNKNDSHPADVAGFEPTIGEETNGADGEVNADGTVNEEPCQEQPSDDAEIEEAASQEKDGHNRNENDNPTRDEYAERRFLHSTLDDIRFDSLYFNEREPIEERTKRAPKLVVQQMEYLRLMEDRMKSVEEKLLLIEDKEVELKPPTLRRTNLIADFIMGIKRMTFQEYLPVDPNPGITKPMEQAEHKPRHEFPGQLPYHLIDVVVSAIHQSERLSKEQGIKLAGDSPDPAISRLDTPYSSTQTLTTLDGQHLQPERVRINSTLLLEALQEITGLEFAKSKIGDDSELRDQVILRPFKLFVTFEQEIRDGIDRLEKVHISNRNNGESEAPEMASGEGQNPPPSPKTHISHDMAGHLGGKHLNDFNNDESPCSKAHPMDIESRLDSRRCLEEMLVLRELLDKDLKATFDLRKQIKEGVVRSIAFQDLWHLFSIGDEIVSNDSSGQYQVYRVLNVSGGRSFLSNRLEVDMDAWEPTSNGRDLPKFEILSYFYDYDGKELGACQQLHTVKSYDGYKAITSLPCFPIIYSRNSKGLKPRDFFIERGRRFIALTHEKDVVHKRYNGRTLAMDGLREEVDSEVIIDVSMAMLKNSVTVQFGVAPGLERDPRELHEVLDPRCRFGRCCQNDSIHYDYHVDEKRVATLLENKAFMHEYIGSDSELTKEDHLVCPCWVYGYVLRSRKWVRLDVSLVEDIEERGNGFDSLVLPEGHKETLLALVGFHSKRKGLGEDLKAESRQMDLVRGKGKGLIILLHGEPGVGKSSTAESVAEFTHRPLFQVTCGDIGESADEVEQRLENHFQLAHKWGCVLLLDEADVFLEARSKTDLKRNAIVSVFLRVLEYYSGILFLTTNRVGAFDQAFRSRIHMSLFYPRIEEDATIKIWKMNIDRAREIWGDKLTIDKPDRDGILEFASKHYRELAKSETTWNGRQIRNAFQTAIALAEWDVHQVQIKLKSSGQLTPRLEPAHFQKVAKASKHFDAYLKETQAGTVADLAREHKERRDDFPGGES